MTTVKTKHFFTPDETDKYRRACARCGRDMTASIHISALHSSREDRHMVDQMKHANAAIVAELGELLDCVQSDGTIAGLDEFARAEYGTLATVLRDVLTDLDQRQSARVSVMAAGKCRKPQWFGSGMPAGLCGNEAYGKQVHDRDYLVAGPACPVHGGPSLQEAIAGRTVIRFDGPPGPEAGRFVEVERDGKSINAGQWVQDGDYWLLVLDK